MDRATARAILDSAGLSHVIPAHTPRNLDHTLSPRQRSAIILYASIRSMVRAADEMGISHATLRRHLRRAYSGHDM